MANAITPRQQDVLNFVRQYDKTNQKSPTFREIAKGIGISDLKMVSEHLRGIERAGLITLHARAHRGIQLLVREDSDLIPVYGKVAAGLPLEAAENVTREVPIPRGLFQKNPDFGAMIHGDSMEDLKIFHGDIAFFEWAETANFGAIVLVHVNTDEMSRDERKRCGIDASGLTLKKLGASGNRLLLKSANRAKGYEPFSLDPALVRIEGLFMGCVRVHH